MPLLFQSPLIEDYIRSKHPNSHLKDLVIQPPTGSTPLYTKYKALENDEWVEKNLIISQWEVMSFIYSKIESQETEAPTTVEFRIDGQAIKKMVSESHEKILELPFESQEFQDAWKDFLNYRIEMAGSISLEKTEKILKKLSKWEERDAIKSLENSISNGWSDVYPKVPYIPRK